MKQLYVVTFYTLRTIISKNGVKIKPETNAYYLISLFQGVNLLSIYNLLKSIFKLFNNFEPTLLLFVIMFFLPPFVFNYLFFIRNNRFEVLIKEIADKPISPRRSLITVGSYIIFTILFFGFSILVNA